MAGFHSKALGRHVTADDLAEIDDHAVICDLWFEVGDALSDLNSKLLRVPRHVDKRPNPQHDELSRMRAFLAPFHQRVAHRKSQLRDTLPFPRQSPIRGESPHSDAMAAVPTVESLYFLAARKELDPATHQRLVLIAEQRRNAAISLSTGLAMGR